MIPEALNETHDPSLLSWVQSANNTTTEFPIQNLPLGIFRRVPTSGAPESFRAGVAIGDQILDVGALGQLDIDLWWPYSHSNEAGTKANEKALITQALNALSTDRLNKFLALGQPSWRALRRSLSASLRQGARAQATLQDHLIPQAIAEYALPTQIGDYTDFFTSYHHMVNVGSVMAPNAPPMANFKWLPVAYHGRASSIAISGTPVRRPLCQYKSAPTATPAFGATTKLDYEFEFGAIIGTGNPLGSPIPIGDAEQAIYGLCILNDWSARDIQAWESMPLGPFLSKNFLTSLSPWVVSMEALLPFRVALPRTSDDPQTLDYLRIPETADGLSDKAGIDISMAAWLVPHDDATQRYRLSRSSFKYCYWALSQMLAHQTSNGCNVNPGDLLGTGTQSGPSDGEQGCLIELTHGGTRPLQLSQTTSRIYLQDGDTVQLTAWCEHRHYRKIGFGRCVGQIQPAIA